MIVCVCVRFCVLLCVIDDFRTPGPINDIYYYCNIEKRKNKVDQ